MGRKMTEDLLCGTCTCSCMIMCSLWFWWDGGPIVQMGWSITEDLLCVADDGSVLVYDIHGAIKKTLSMGQVSKKTIYFYNLK